MSAMEQFYAQLQQPAAAQDERGSALARLAETELDDLVLQATALDWANWEGESAA